jgi:hypothetical protein
MLSYGLHVIPYAEPWNADKIMDGLYIGDVYAAYNDKRLQQEGTNNILRSCKGRYIEINISDIVLENIGCYSVDIDL